MASDQEEKSSPRGVKRNKRRPHGRAGPAPAPAPTTTTTATGGHDLEAGAANGEERAGREGARASCAPLPPPPPLKHTNEPAYDHNRNLTTNNEQQQQRAQRPEGGDALRGRANESPVSLLSVQSGDSAPAFPCDLNLTSGSSASSSSSAVSASHSAAGSEQSTERMSQTSLAAGRACGESDRPQAQRAVKFQVGDTIDLGPAQANDKQHQQQQQERRGRHMTAISIEEDGARQEEPGASLMRQLGRRVSLFPQALARQVGAGRRRANPEEGPRRFSVPVGAHGAHEERAPLRAPDHTAAAGAPEPPPAAVAGVGGTITTVTRSKRKTAPLPRLVAKNGQVNLFLDNIDRRQYVRDLFTTMIDIKWRYNLMAAAFGFVFSWLFFACVWYLVLYLHNDLEHENDPSWSPCIVNVYSFPAALLFSIETQSTLGFGSRIISVECPGAILIFCSQLIFGVVVECLIVGMVFAKLSRPTKRSQTIMFSKCATVCLREGKLCLTFRVGDVRSKSHIIGATLRASLVSSKVTREGEIIPFYHHKLRVIIDDCKNSLLLIWPVTIVHVIDESSPFFKLNADELANFKFEIITVLEGTVESTGQSIQVRSSYLPSEVKWGFRFEPIVSTHGCGRYAQTIIDYNKFNQILGVCTPKCSAKEYYADQAAAAAAATACEPAPRTCESCCQHSSANSPPTPPPPLPPPTPTPTPPTSC